MPLYRTRALVLRSMHLSETDKLITFFTHRYGKVKGVAKGARRIKSRYGASLEPMTHMNLIYFGKEHQGLMRVNTCDINDSFQALRENPHTCYPALYFIELVDTLTGEGQPDPHLFEFLLSALHALESLNDHFLLIRLFEFKLLSMLGYKPELDECIRCRQVPETVWVGFSYNGPGISCQDCMQSEPVELKIQTQTLQYLKKLLTLDLQHCGRLKPPRTAGLEMEQLTRRLVLARLGRELKSYPLLKDLAVIT